MATETLNDRDVRAWLASVEQDLKELGARLAPLLAEQKRLEERRSLLEGLLRSLDDARPTITPSARAEGTVGAYVAEKATEILRDEGAPLHINELHEKFIERGFAIPGAGKSANLIVHLRSADGIVSPQRGVYGLTEQVGPVAPRSRRKKRRRAPTHAGGS